MGRHHHHKLPTVVPCETTPLFGKSESQSEKLTPKETLIGTLIFLVVIVIVYFIPAPAISLQNFSFSHLHITDHQISSADWEIGLALHNRARDTANYTDIRYTVVYCGDPASQPIVDAHKQYDDLILPANGKTVVHLKHTVENLALNRLALSYMTMDVIRDGCVDFDIVVKVTVMTGNDKKRYLMNCKGIQVTISPRSWDKQDTHNGAGYARNTSNCYIAETY